MVSDLHLGARLGRDVLRQPPALAALLEALDGIDRLVLLGDVIELLEAPHAEALVAAEPILRAIGTRMGAEREIVVVPGNHDAALVRPWLRAHGVPLAVDATIPCDGSPALARVTRALAPARVQVRYPGVWLSHRIWATHGHYLDHHLLPAGAHGLVHRRRTDVGRPGAYERSRPSTPARLEALLSRRLPRPLAMILEGVAELARAATMPSLHRAIGTHRLAPLTTVLLGTQMQRASLPALATVARRLGVDADWVLFGHVHRLGPLAGDDPQRWSAPGGRPRLANTGSWTFESLLLHRGRPPHPYWPGGALLLEGDGDPQPLGLLDHLGPATLRGQAP